jgi:hypothetical protein
VALLEQAEMIVQSSDEAVHAAPDRADVRRRYDDVVATAGMRAAASPVGSPEPSGP